MSGSRVNRSSGRGSARGPTTRASDASRGVGIGTYPAVVDPQHRERHPHAVLVPLRGHPALHRDGPRPSPLGLRSGLRYAHLLEHPVLQERVLLDVARLGHGRGRGRGDGPRRRRRPTGGGGPPTLQVFRRDGARSGPPPARASRARGGEPAERERLRAPRGRLRGRRRREQRASQRVAAGSPDRAEHGVRRESPVALTPILPTAQVETSRVSLSADARSHRRQFSRRAGRRWGRPDEIRGPRLRGRRQVGRTRDRALAAPLPRGRAMVRASRATRPASSSPRVARARTPEMAPPHPMPSPSPSPPRPPLSLSVSISAGSTSGAGTTSAPRSSTCPPTPASS